MCINRNRNRRGRESNTSLSQFVLKTINVNGYCKEEKRDIVHAYMHGEKPELIVLCDTRASTIIEGRIWAEQSVYNFVATPGKDAARGVMIYIRRDFPAKILNVVRDHRDNNYIIIKLEVYNEIITICGVYGPNQENVPFWQRVFDKVDNQNCPYWIMAGDFNVCRDVQIDQVNYVPSNRMVRSRAVLNRLISEREVNDEIREKSGRNPRFTWKRFNAEQYARLDHILNSKALTPYVVKSEIEAMFPADHKVLSITIDFHRFKSGKGTWKVPHSLIGTPAYDSMVINSYKEVLERNYKPEGRRGNFYEDKTEEEHRIFMTMEPEELANIPLKRNANAVFEEVVLKWRGDTIRHGNQTNKDSTRKGNRHSKNENKRQGKQATEGHTGIFSAQHRA